MLGRKELVRFAALFEQFAAHTAFLSEELLRIELIINPRAGHFSRRSVFRERLQVLKRHLDRQKKSERRLVECRMHHTEYHGHAVIIADEIRKNIERSGTGKTLIVTAGGDGTHQEVMSSFIGISDKEREKLCFFRLPLGTGNDGADSEDLDEACRVLAGPTACRSIDVLQIGTADEKFYFAFNIASLGIDAYVTDMTNRLKGLLPGDGYKLIADAATLFYAGIYGVGTMDARIEGPAGQQLLSGPYILFAFGVSGKRTYGDHKHILPGIENVCAIENRKLKEKIELKKRLFEGGHVALTGVEQAEMNEMQVDYDRKIPMQTDGEAVWLEPNDFPLTIRRLREVLPILSPADG